MLSSGLPAEQAIQYFTESADPAEISAMLAKWQRSRSVQRAQVALMGKAWQEMSLDEKCETGLNQTYAGQAYLLFSVNYISASPAEKAKLDTARATLEARKAGTSGKMNALEQFFEDVKNKKLVLPQPVKRLDS